jgi:hypothetical protein
MSVHLTLFRKKGTATTSVFIEAPIPRRINSADNIVNMTVRLRGTHFLPTTIDSGPHRCST